MAKAPVKYKNIGKLNQKIDELNALANKFLAQNQVDKALDAVLQVHKLIPANPSPLDHAAAICVIHHRWEDAVNYAKKSLARQPDYINSLHALSHASHRLQDYEQAKIAGSKALQLIEKSLGLSQLPALPEKQLKADGKNLISFSLFGNSPIYLEAAVMNTQLAAKLYPNWVCRFYVDESVPETAITRLQENGAEIVQMNDPAISHIPKTIWRFLAADDPNVNYVIFRDADSVISQPESELVKTWIASGKRFHTIRDSGSHTELILAGLWGMLAGSVPNMRTLIEEFIAEDSLDQRFADQHFLRKKVWQYACQDLLSSDSVFDFGENLHRFDKGYNNEFDIGSRETTAVFRIDKKDCQDGERFIWRLFTRVSLDLSADGKIQIEDEERFVCEYEGIVKNGIILCHLPKRYAQGVKDGYTRITLKKVE